MGIPTCPILVRRHVYIESVQGLYIETGPRFATLSVLGLLARHANVISVTIKKMAT